MHSLCSVVILPVWGKHSSRGAPRIEVAGHVFEVVTRFKYLGVWFASDICLDIHKAVSFERFFAASQIALKLVRQLQITTVSQLVTIFHSLVYSQLYGVELFFWDLTAVNLELIRFLKKALLLPRSTSLVSLQFVVKAIPFSDQLLVRKVKFFKRLALHSSELVQSAIDYDVRVLSTFNLGWARLLFRDLIQTGCITAVEDLNNVFSTVDEMRRTLDLTFYVTASMSLNEYPSLRYLSDIPETCVWLSRFRDCVFPRDITRVLFAIVLGSHRAVYCENYLHYCPLCLSYGVLRFFSFNHLFFECSQLQDYYFQFFSIGGIRAYWATLIHDSNTDFLDSVRFLLGGFLASRIRYRVAPFDAIDLFMFSLPDGLP